MTRRHCKQNFSQIGHGEGAFSASWNIGFTQFYIAALAVFVPIFTNFKCFRYLIHSRASPARSCLGPSAAFGCLGPRRRG